METFIVLSILFFLSTCILSYICWNLYRKIAIYEPEIEYYQTFYTKFAELLTFVEAKLLEVDNRGSFSADDEIGFAYKSIKSLWKLLFDMGLQTKQETEEYIKNENVITASQLKNLPSIKILKNMPTSDKLSSVSGKRVM